MLDFTQLVAEIEGMAEARRERRADADRSLSRALAQIEEQSGTWEALAEKLRLRQWPWVLAIPREPFNTRRSAPAPPDRYAVVASDGSQIAPDRHEVSSCYLLNISRIRLSYGDGERPLMDSRPHLYFDEKDLSVEDGGVRLPIEGKYLAIRRMLEETLQLVKLARETARQERPCVAMADGTLIQWPISREAEGYSGQALRRFLEALGEAQDCGSPVIGYISDPGGSSVVATMRAALCPAGFLQGSKCPCMVANDGSADGMAAHSTAAPKDGPSASSSAAADAEAPCHLLALTADARLFGRLLSPGERSAIFESTSQVLSRYGPHAICFFYLNVGREIARVEFPMWVANDPAAVELVHGVVLDQAVKGRGYPVALSEAHERAVVQSGDRAVFYQMVQKAFVRRGLPAEISVKAMSKRQPVV